MAVGKSSKCGGNYNKGVLTLGAVQPLQWYANFYVKSIFLGREFIAFIRLSKWLMALKRLNITITDIEILNKTVAILIKKNKRMRSPNRVYISQARRI